MTTIDERPSTTVPPKGVVGRLFRAAVTLHTVVAFGQPVFAGVYLSGEIGGLDWHARGADVVFSLGVLQVAVAVAAWVRWGLRWPTAVSVLILVAESGQYGAGLAGLLWVHLPLGVMIIASLAVLSAALWVRPLPDRAATADQAQGASKSRRDETHV
ncbi:hypothetical protein EOT10_07095 [Streptomyces antnestii]|uniref:Uncharacterized protein n=1 Tax=Streptomyces antnestii TaxID=2494256 RepID=A0A437Q0I1_9ACTN|nr:hypothetical protein [Streptomyces sp. San01]RVU28021.1 hypothetical protein EOT10_07095 [Streptomyces sp. San01]